MIYAIKCFRLRMSVKSTQFVGYMFYTVILKKIFLPNFVLKVMTKKFVEKLQIWLQYQIIQKIGYYLILI